MIVCARRSSCGSAFGREFNSPRLHHDKSLVPQQVQGFFCAYFWLFSLMFSLYRLEMPLMYCSIRSALACFISSVTCPYTSSVKAAAWWPRLPWTVLISSPARRDATAKLCPYGIIRTNRKTLVLQRVGGLPLFFFHQKRP